MTYNPQLMQIAEDIGSIKGTLEQIEKRLGKVETTVNGHNKTIWTARGAVAGISALVSAAVAAMWHVLTER